MIYFLLVVAVIFTVFIFDLLFIEKQKISDIFKNKIYSSIIIIMLFIFMFCVGVELAVVKKDRELSVVVDGKETGQNIEKDKIYSENKTHTEKSEKDTNKVNEALEYICKNVKLIDDNYVGYKKQEVTEEGKKFEFFLDGEEKIKLIKIYAEDEDFKFYYDKDEVIYVEGSSLNSYYFSGKKLIQFVNNKENKIYNSLNVKESKSEEFLKNEKLQYERAMKYYKSYRAYLNFVKTLKFPECIGTDISNINPAFKIADITGDGVEENIILTTCEEELVELYSYNVYVQDINSGKILYKNTLKSGDKNNILIGERKEVSLDVCTIDKSLNNVIAVTIYSMGNIGEHGTFIMYMDQGSMKCLDLSNIIKKDINLKLTKNTACITVPSLKKEYNLNIQPMIKNIKVPAKNYNLYLSKELYEFEYDKSEKVSKIIKWSRVSLGTDGNVVADVAIKYKFNSKDKSLIAVDCEFISMVNS